MLEKALSGSRLYWFWMILLALAVAAGFAFYLVQLRDGLVVTGMDRDISWGLYIGQFTFFVGVAASAVTVVLPYYLHDHRVFGPITILGEFLAISSVVMCLAFIFADMGQPFRILNVFLYPSPKSPMFWDTVVLSGYLVLNLAIGWATLGAERKHLPPPRWVKPLIYVSIPWAISIHTVTAFIYAGLPDRHLWLSAITAVRFLASAFASGPALLLLLCAAVGRFTSFRPGREPRAALSVIIVYAFTAHVFFLILEFFTAYYSGIPAYRHSLGYLFFGAGGGAGLMPVMAVSVALRRGRSPAAPGAAAQEKQRGHDGGRGPGVLVHHAREGGRVRAGGLQSRSHGRACAIRTHARGACDHGRDLGRGAPGAVGPV